jgi:Rieske Fe-S protein
MLLNRREFLILTAGFAAGCSSTESSGTAAAVGGVTNAGPASNYVADGVYSAFRTKGFFIIRKGGKLFALSSVCTHRRCFVKAVPNHSFYCPCHGSTFGPDGLVTHGPARRNLPELTLVLNEAGDLVVTVPPN